MTMPAVTAANVSTVTHDLWIGGVNWTVKVRHEWERINTRESPRRVSGLELEIYGVVEWGEQGDRSVEPVDWVHPLSGWLVDRERVAAIAIEIDFGNGTVASYP